MSNLTLTRKDRIAINAVGNKAWTGNELKEILEERCRPSVYDAWEQSVSIDFQILDSPAWEIVNLWESTNRKVPNLPEFLAQKIHQFCIEVTE